MAINALWIPIINEAVSWVAGRFNSNSNSNIPQKDLQLKISELEHQVQSLTAGNEMLMQNLNLIIQAVLQQLKDARGFTVNADSIFLIGENSGSIHQEDHSVLSDKNIGGIKQRKKKEEGFDVSKIFDGVDEEISHTRVTKSTDRG